MIRIPEPGRRQPTEADPGHDHVEGSLGEPEEKFRAHNVDGQVLDANFQVAMDLKSMPDSFNPLSMALESRSDADLTFDLVKTKLIDEAAKQNCSGKAQSVLEAGTRKPIICHHKQKDCRLLAQSREAEPKKNEPKQHGRSTKASCLKQS